MEPKKCCLKALEFIARNAFGASLVVLLFTLILGTLVFYKYVILSQKTDIKSSDSFQTKEKLYKEIADFWHKEEEMFQRADLKEYPDPFRVRREINLLKEEKASE